MVVPEPERNIEEEAVDIDAEPEIDDYLLEEDDESRAEETTTSFGEDKMTAHWKGDTARCVNRDSPDYRVLRNLSEMMRAWIQQNSGLNNPSVWDKMDKLTPDGGVRKRSIHPGQPGMRLDVHGGIPFIMSYTLYVEPNFDEPADAIPYRDKPREIHRLGEESTLFPGMHIALQTMCLGEGAHLRITADYAYRDQGCPPRIPKNATLHYIVQVRDEDISTGKAMHKFLRQPEDVKAQLGFDVCFAAAQDFREKGVEMFKKKDDKRAIEAFEDGDSACQACLDIILQNKKKPEELGENYAERNQEVLEQKRALMRNAMVCYARLGNWKRVKKIGESLVKVCSQDVRIVYYYAQALKELGQADKAMEYTRRGLDLSPSSPELSELFKQLRVLEQKYQDSEKIFCKRIFGSLVPDSQKENAAQPTVSGEVQQHVTECIAKIKKGAFEVPVNYSFFSDKVNMAFLKAEATKNGLTVVERKGRMRPIIQLTKSRAG